MTSFEWNTNFTIIDNEDKWNEIKTNWSLDNIQSKSNDLIESKEIELENKNALDILKTIDAGISGHDIDLAYDRGTKAYHFISWDKSIDFPIKFNSLKDVWNILISLFNKNIKLEWWERSRTIKESWITNFFKDPLISNSDLVKNPLFWENTTPIKYFELSDEEIDEIFVFIKQVKWISKEEWNIDKMISKDYASKQYIDKLWIEYNQNQEPFSFKENQAIETENNKEIKIKKILEYTLKNKDIFKNKSLEQIKNIIASNTKERKELSLLFLANSLSKWYKFKRTDMLSYIKNFTSSNIECKYTNNPSHNSYLDFTLNWNTVSVFDDNEEIVLEINIDTTNDDNKYDVEILEEIGRQIYINEE